MKVCFAHEHRIGGDIAVGACLSRAVPCNPLPLALKASLLVKVGGIWS
jgi:hypothetical protein